ncbi:MAG: cupin domain-containing protein [Burkholderiaceae bacterium]
MSIDISPEQMEKRVSRFDKLRAQPGIFLDFAFPECEREIFRVLGNGVKDRASLEIAPAIDNPVHFNIGMARCQPGHGAALHSHLTDEVFLALDGTWLIMWGDQGEHSITLNQWDVIAVPPGVMRGFRNIGDTTACLYTVLGGADPGRLTWSPDVVRRARERGYELDEAGHLKPVQAVG